jgi:hypothetical protein
MFWDQGWNNAPEAAKDALDSFKLLNPTFTVHALDSTHAEKLTNRSQYVPNAVWRNMTVQAKSDVYRTLLLYLHGGIWADASLDCNMPLDSWLPIHLTELFALRRFDNLSQQNISKIRPWISSWFLASPRGGATIGKILGVISDPLQHHRFFQEYFWWHRILAELCQTDKHVWQTVREYPSADPAHCVTPDFWTSAPMFKRCAAERFSALLPKSRQCCLNTLTNEIKPYFCSKWKCSILSLNWSE